VRRHGEHLAHAIAPDQRRSEVQGVDRAKRHRQRVARAGLPGDRLWSPDGRRLVVEALESYEADIGMIDMK